MCFQNIGGRNHGPMVCPVARKSRVKCSIICNALALLSCTVNWDLGERNWLWIMPTVNSEEFRPLNPAPKSSQRVYEVLMRYNGFTFLVLAYLLCNLIYQQGRLIYCMPNRTEGGIFSNRELKLKAAVCCFNKGFHVIILQLFFSIRRRIAWWMLLLDECCRKTILNHLICLAADAVSLK